MQTVLTRSVSAKPTAPDVPNTAGLGWKKKIAGMLIAGIGWIPMAAAAQSAWYWAPSFAFGRVYDDNVFGSALQPQSDYLWRFSPALQAGYRSPALSFDGYYTFDMERYSAHPQLDSNQARKNAAVDLKYHASPRLDLTMDGVYAKTNTSNQLSEAAGLQLGRATAAVYSLQPAVSYRFTPLTTGTASYSFTRETLEGGIDSDTRSASLTLTHALDERNSASLNLQGSDYQFSQGGATSTRALTAGWVHEFSPNTSLSLQAGPRVTEGTHSTDIFASLSQTEKYGKWSLAYSRVLGTIIGIPGTVDIRIASANVVYWPNESWQFQLLPTFISDRSVGPPIKVYELQLRVGYRLSQALSLVGWYQADVQHGALNASPDERITRHVVFIGLVVAFGTASLPQLPPPPSPFGGLLPEARPLTH
ncbi:MAG TPA: hypothetical protein VJS89_01380 [Gammaproteobacteria bacterium]|nr:hypothetical protein [Gammaproteobacteria bacterium]